VKEKKHTVRRTSLNLDFGLVDEAREALGTRGTTETVHAALREIALRDRRRRLLARDFSMLTPELIEELRRPELEWD
jgi:Arc/MetJ family transcription regulator